LGIILGSELNWVDQINDTAQNAKKALHFVMGVLKKRNRNKNLSYTEFVSPIPEYRAACWNQCGE
jgi:hypothetical protein